MDSLVFLLLHLLLYGISPILIISIFKTFKSTAFFYSYFGFLYVFTQLFAVLYSLPISEDIIISGGNIAYCSIILITFFIGIASQDPAVVRNLITIQVVFNFLLYFLYQLLIIVLNDPLTINIFAVSSGIFTATITINIASSVSFIIEILILFYSVIKIKEYTTHLYSTIVFYILIYILVLCLDGFLFPFIVSFFEPEFGQIIVGSFIGKLILSLGFSPFLLIFMIIHKKSVILFIKKPFSLRLVIFPKRIQLLEKLRRTEQNLKETEKKYEIAYNTATFYKDLFTHDISNLIQNISLSFNLLNDNRRKNEKLNSEDSDRLYDSINNQIIRSINLISNVQKLDQIDKGKIQLKHIPLLEYLTNSIRIFKESMTQKPLEINVEGSEKDIIVNANEFIVDVFENLISNAVKYNNNRIPEITIIISRVKSESVNNVKLEFKDNGIGIPDTHKKKIFLEGYKELKGGKGMGIGLSLISKIIKSYKGKIWVEDRIKGDPSKGSNFIILIPEIFKN